MTLEDLKTRKIAVLGFGKEGQATAAFLKSHGIVPAAVLDMKNDGPGYLDQLNDFDVLFRSPGIPRRHPKLLEFKDQDAIYSHIKLFFDLCPCPIVAVTGTKGKTTTSTLLYEMIKASGKKSFLGGNIGEPPLNFLDQITPDSVVVLEVSSFQAQDLQKSPHVGVILTVTHDHLDDGTFRPSSHSSQNEYVNAKAQLIANQSEDDFAVLHPGLGDVFINSGRGKKVFYHTEDVQGYETRLIGRHNQENISAAANAAKLLSVDEESIKKAVAEFSGVPQRLQLVAEKNGIKFVNDSASTNPDSTIAAIDSFKNGVVLIAGGSEKELDYAELGQKILSAPQVKGLVAIGQVAPKIIESVKGFAGQVLTGAKNMQEILAQALTLAEPGDVVLLSPAAASFDMFENAKDRGNQFDQIVNQL